MKNNIITKYLKLVPDKTTIGVWDGKEGNRICVSHRKEGRILQKHKYKELSKGIKPQVDKLKRPSPTERHLSSLDMERVNESKSEKMTEDGFDGGKNQRCQLEDEEENFHEGLNL